MTLIEIKNQLLGHFTQFDTFSIPKQYKTVKVGEEQEKHREQIVTLVLKQMAKDGLIEPVENKEGIIDTYVLIYPVTHQRYDINVSLTTSNLIGEIINQFANSTGNKAMIADKSKIIEEDLQNLCIICAQLANTQDDDDDNSEDKETE